MLAPSVMKAVSASKEKITLSQGKPWTAKEKLNPQGHVISSQSSTVTNWKETSGMQRWKAPQARNLNFGKGSPSREPNWQGQAQA